MTIKSAIDHFKFKLSNVWKPTQKDAEAINSIIEFVEQKHQQQLQDNQLFAKLYVAYYGELLRYYQSSVYEPQAQEALHKILDTPLQDTIERFKNTLNTSELYYALKDDVDVSSPIAEAFSHVHPERLEDYISGCTNPNTKAQKIAEYHDYKKASKAKLQKLLKQHPNYFTQHEFTYQTVEDNLTAQINKALNVYGS